jgi:hypothetical protein
VSAAGLQDQGPPVARAAFEGGRRGRCCRYLQEYYSDGSWRIKNVGSKTVCAGGGSANRAVGRQTCQETSRVSWRPQIDVVTPLQRFEQLRAQGWSLSQARDQCVEFGRGIHCTVREVACFDDSAVIPLREQMGWGVQARGLRGDEQCRLVTAESLTRDVLTVVVPKDAEQTGEDHPWREFVATLEAAGVHSTPHELACLPYNVVFAPRLHDALYGASTPPASTFVELFDQ